MRSRRLTSLPLLASLVAKNDTAKVNHVQLIRRTSQALEEAGKSVVDDHLPAVWGRRPSNVL